VNFAILGRRGVPSPYSGYETLARYPAPTPLEAGHSVSVCSREPDGKGGPRTTLELPWDADGPPKSLDGDVDAQHPHVLVRSRT
jgi:hypothetical protein